MTLQSTSSLAAIGGAATATAATATAIIKITRMIVMMSWKDIVYKEGGVPNPLAVIDII